MKTNIINNRVSRWAVALSVLVGFAACSTDNTDSDKEWVDPRYRNLEDSYTIAADGSEQITFEIKSNMEWWVYNTNEDWCTISPESGDDPDTTYEVTLNYSANSDLEDRVDTFFLKSDYWVFKEIEVTQKGVATLSIDKESDFISNDGDLAKGTLIITTNQNWSVEITDGGDWLSFDAGTTTSGSGDGSSIAEYSVAYSAVQNEVEQRSATIEVYNRNDEVQYTYIVTQDGLLLTTTDELYFFDYTGGEVTLPINTNLEWMVEVVSTTAWITNLEAVNSLDYPDGDVEDHVKLTLSTNNGESRAVYLRLTSQMNVAGIEEIVYYVGVVQGSGATPEVTYLNTSDTFASLGTNNWYLYAGTAPSIVAGAQGVGYCSFTTAGRVMTYPSEIPFGRYDITVSDVEGNSASTFFFFLQFDSTSANYVGFNLYAGEYKAAIVTGGANLTGWPSSYSPSALEALNDAFAGYSITDTHKIGVNIYQGDLGYLCYEWYIDDILILSESGTTWLNDTYSCILNMVVGVNGTTTGRFYSYSYTAPSEYDARPEMPTDE
ncbi:MAG: BACON domain-containing carbohydrate-binding protein [Rikenellaceae bacterium]